MNDAMRHIAFYLFASVYLATASSTLLLLVEPIYSSAGPATYREQTGVTKELPKPKFVQRRHLPLAKVAQLTPDAALAAESPEAIELVVCAEHARANAPNNSPYYFSILSSRAPPFMS